MTTLTNGELFRLLVTLPPDRPVVVDIVGTCEPVSNAYAATFDDVVVIELHEGDDDTEAS